MKIGIVPRYNENKRPFLNTFSFVNNYAYRVFKNGGVPFGILFPNGVFDESFLKEYDGFIITGGEHIFSYHVLTVHYAFKNDKPLLGICMGMQAIGLYGYIVYRLKKERKEIDYENIADCFRKIDENEWLEKVKNHNLENPFYNKNIKNASHIIYPLSSLFKGLYGLKIMEPSLHDYAIKKVYDDFIVSACSFDGVVEAIECVSKKFIVGVQFHPELEDKNDKLFKYFINACK